MLLGLVLAIPAAADLRVRERLVGADGEARAERTWVFAFGKIRFDQGPNGFVLDSNAEAGWMYGSGGCERLPAPGTGPSTTKPVAASPYEARLASALGEVASGGVAVGARSERRTLAGVEAQRFIVVRNGETIQERWYALAVKNPDLDAVVQRLVASGRLNALMGLEAAQIAAQTVGFGYPVLVKDLVTGESIEVTEIDTKKQPSSAFTLPAGCPGR